MISSSVEKIKNLVVDKNAPFVISIDGPCAGGKSTLASKLQEELNCNVVHMDDFYLPFDKRDKNWMNMTASHMDFDKVINMIPGMANIMPEGSEKEASKKIKKYLCIMDSMTDAELNCKHKIDDSRAKRIARGSGCSILEVKLMMEEYKKFSKKALNLG